MINQTGKTEALWEYARRNNNGSSLGRLQAKIARTSRLLNLGLAAFNTILYSISGGGFPLFAVGLFLGMWFEQGSSHRLIKAQDDLIANQKAYIEFLEEQRRVQ